MELGVRVRILSDANYNGRFTGQLGTIAYVTGLCAGKSGVKIDGRKNHNSKYGVFWFEDEQLQIIESEEKTMLPNYITANIRFLDGTNRNTTYAYALYDEDIAAGDTVVVKTGHHGYAVAQVVEVAPEIAEAVKFGREIVSRVDFSAFEARKAKAKRMAELKRTMDEKVRELQATALYEMLAEKDSGLKEMLAEYKNLQGGQS